MLTFRTEPLAETLDFAGRPILTARVEFSSPSTHLFAKLQDVHPDEPRARSRGAMSFSHSRRAVHSDWAWTTTHIACGAVIAFNYRSSPATSPTTRFTRAPMSAHCSPRAGSSARTASTSAVPGAHDSSCQ